MLSQRDQLFRRGNEAKTEAKDGIGIQGTEDGYLFINKSRSFLRRLRSAGCDSAGEIQWRVALNGARPALGKAYRGCSRQRL